MGETGTVQRGVSGAPPLPASGAPALLGMPPSTPGAPPTTTGAPPSTPGVPPSTTCEPPLPLYPDNPDTAPPIPTASGSSSYQTRHDETMAALQTKAPKQRTNRTFIQPSSIARPARSAAVALCPEKCSESKPYGRAS